MSEPIVVKGGDDCSQEPHPSRCPLSRRWTLFLFAFGTTSLVSGVVYGWPALRRQLQEDGTTLTESQLGAIYTVGAWGTQGGRFFTGLARDRWGTRNVACFSLLCTVAGAIGLALADPSGAVALGLSLFAISLGAGVQLVVQPVGSLFPQTSNCIISSLSGSFQISGLIFLALTSLPVSRRDAFVGYAVLVALLILLAWILLPKSASFLVRLPTATGSLPPPLVSENEDELEEGTEPPPKDSSDIQKVGLSKLQQLISMEYILLFSWFSISLIPMQYYIGSIGYQLEQKGDDDGFYANLFSIVYAASAVVAPAGGALSDQYGLGVTQGGATILVAMSFFILGSHVIPLPGQAAGLVCYGVGRMLLFGMFFSNIGRRFGYVHYGTLAGLGLLGSAIVSILQYPLIAAAATDPITAQRVNFGWGSALLALVPYCAWLAITERRRDSAQSLLT